MNDKIEGLQIKYINNKITFSNVKNSVEAFIELTNSNDDLVTILNQLREILINIGFSSHSIDVSYLAILKAHIEYLKENYDIDYNIFENREDPDMTIDEYLKFNKKEENVNIENKVFKNVDNFKYEVNNNPAFLNFIFDHLKDEFNVEEV